MYGDTEEVADILVTKLAELGVENIKIYDLAAFYVSYQNSHCHSCLLYTSDAADDAPRV